MAEEGIEPMLARAISISESRSLVYEPKWDGHRCLLFIDGGWVSLRSRNNRELDRVLNGSLRSEIGRLPVESAVFDGELLALAPDGRFHFPSVAGLGSAGSRDQPIMVLFDVIYDSGRDVRGMPLNDRKELLSRDLESASLPLLLSPVTDDYGTATRWMNSALGNGVDGIMAKDPQGTYRPGERGWVKIRHAASADCVVAGIRRNRGLVVSLLLGLYEEDGGLKYAGALAGFSRDDREEFTSELTRLRIPIEDHPWGRSGGEAEMPKAEWEPIQPVLVCEVEFSLVERGKFRHPPKLRRWRFDRSPRSCLVSQLDD